MKYKVHTCKGLVEPRCYPSFSESLVLFLQICILYYVCFRNKICLHQRQNKMNLHHIILSSPWEPQNIEQKLILFVSMTIKKRKFKQWWSKTPSISTKRKITSDLNSLNTEKRGVMLEMEVRKQTGKASRSWSINENT
jgi:hypothetical protein